MPLLMLLFVAIQAAFAARLDASLPVQELTVGQTVELTVQLTDGSANGLPAVAHDPGLDVTYQGQGQSVVTVNFKTTRIRRFTYLVTAVAEGTQTLGPVTLRAGADDLTVAPVAVVVRPRSTAERAAHDLQVELSDPAPFVGEVVSYRIRYRRTEDIQGRSFELPEFDGFLQEASVEPEGREYRVGDGDRVAQVEEFAVPLVASGQGERTISPTLLTLQIPEERQRNRRFDPFFDRTPVRTERLASDTLKASVRPLPVEGQPAGFSGLVGDFELTARPSARQVALGGSITLEVTLEGEGSLTGFSLPPLPDDGGLRAYDDEPEIATALDDGALRSRLVQRRAVVPAREGALTLPPLEVVVFDPATEQYATLRTDPVPIEVLPGEAGGEVASFGDGEVDRRAEVAALGDDILPAPGQASIGDATLSAAWPWALAVGAAPLLLWAGLSLQGRGSARAEDPREALVAGLHALPPDPVARLAALERLFRASAGLRLGVPAPAVDRAAARALSDEAGALYADLEAARYGGVQVADVERRVRAFVEAT